MSRQPNVLLIITDQQRADQLGCAGHPLLRTPHIDALASEGVRASHFHASSTTCMSNRATLMTGRLPSLHGVIHNGINLSHDHTTFVELLSAGGYATALIGKSHLQSFGYDGPLRRKWNNDNAGTPPPDGLQDAFKTVRDGPEYENEWTPDWKIGKRSNVNTPYYGFQHVELATFHGDQVQADYAQWLADRHPNPDSLRGRNNALQAPGYDAPQAWRTALPEELYPSTWIGERTDAWLRRHAERSPDQPFFVQMSFPDPHHPFTPPGRFWDMYDPEQVSLPANFNAPGDSSFIADIYRYTESGGSREGYGAFTVSERECQEIQALSFGMISLIDEQIGRVMATLKALDQDRDTIVIFTSDHGDMMGDHGVVLKGAMHFRGLTHVPFIWRDPQQGAADHVTDIPSSTLDLARTILSRCGLAPFNGMQGVDLAPWLNRESVAQGPAAPQRPGVIIESEPVVLPNGRTQRYRLRSLVNQTARLTVSNLPEFCEFYDLQQDPFEQHNQWHAQATRRAEHCTELLVELSAQADTAPLPTAVA